MTARHAALRRAIATGSLLLVFLFWGQTVQTQDVLTRAKGFYQSASFEEALAALNTLHGKASPPESTEAGVYEVFCLVALGRDDDARRAVEAIVRADPEYRLSDAQASPRVRVMFDGVRARLLPEIARASYASGRAAFDRKDLAAAVADLTRATALISDLDAMKELKDPGLIELRTLASGFRDLATLAIAAAPAATPLPAASPVAPASDSSSPAPPTAPPSAPAGSATPDPKAGAKRLFGPEDEGVQPPAPISQSMPGWQPETAVERITVYHGYLDLVIDEKGRVESASLVRSIHERFDRPLLEAAARWTFQPALKDGAPVRYRQTIQINLGAK